MARCGCLESGLLVLAIACYIFNQAVRKSNRELMWFMARGVMGLSAETKPKSRAVDMTAFCYPTGRSGAEKRRLKARRDAEFDAKK